MGVKLAGCGSGSSDSASAQTTALPSSSIQTVTTSGESVRWARRNISVPSAHEAAAPSIQATPAGRPLSRCNSCHSSRPMARLTQTTASRTRGVMRSPKKAAPISTVKMGMVKPRMAARPEASSCTPKMDSVCQPSTLGRPSQAMVSHSLPEGRMRSPLDAT